MTIIKYLKKLHPIVVSILAVILCYEFKRWGQAVFFDGTHLIQKHPFFPYNPATLLMGFLYGMRIGLFTTVISGALIVSTHLDQIDDWLITIPLYLLTCVLGLWIIVSLKNARENERNQRKAQSNFMAMLAHEIRNPLSTIETAAYSLSLMADSDAAAKKINNHSKALDDISRIVNRLLELDEVENKRIKVVPKSFELKEFLEAIIECASSPERIKMSCAINRLIRTDPDLIRCILVNLVDNAIKYGDPASPIELAAISQRRMGRSGISFRCINALGPYGAPDTTELFSKYYRATPGTGVSGAGIGLWLCKQFAEAMSGVIRFELTDQQVSFHVWLPDLS